jgi:nitrile hydratase accessory protein
MKGDRCLVTMAGTCGCTRCLSERGHFTWKEWAAALANELKAVENRGELNGGTQYYEHWLAALERLVVEKGLTDREVMRERKEAWTEAYLHAAHDKPVELNGSDREHKHS